MTYRSFHSKGRKPGSVTYAMRLLCLTILILTSYSMAESENIWPLANGSGEYTYCDSPSGKTIRVHYYKPKLYTLGSRVVIAMHGETRNDAVRIRAEWIDYAEQLNCIVLAPEFTTIDFPSSSYCLGNITNQPARSGEIACMNPKSAWIYSIVENMFLSFIASEKNESTEYILVCRSSSAMSLMLVPYFYKDLHISIAFAINSGSYFNNDMNLFWPFGTKGVEALQYAVNDKNVFSFPLVFVLGEMDIRPQYMNTYLERDMLLAAGKTNYERSCNAYAKYKKTAESNGEEFLWKLITVPGAGHFDSQLVMNVVEYLKNH